LDGVREKVSRRLLLVLVAVCGFAALLYLRSLRSLLSLGDGCRNERIAEVPSPTSELKAVTFQRDCSATTGYSTQISILPIDAALPPEGGNVFVADTDHGRAPAGPDGGPTVTLEWSGPRELVISHHADARVFKSEPRFGSIGIRYITSAK
jgi:hypothetical protein